MYKFLLIIFLLIPYLSLSDQYYLNLGGGTFMNMDTGSLIMDMGGGTSMDMDTGDLIFKYD